MIDLLIQKVLRLHLDLSGQVFKQVRVGFRCSRTW